MSLKIVDKIKKLLSLATSDNEHEAKLATSKATQLLIKHNLALSDLPMSEKNYQNETIAQKRAGPEDKFVGNILVKYFFVEIVKSRRNGGQLHFLGEETNVEVALYTRDFLTHAFKSAFKVYRAKTGSPANHRQSFYYGLFKGLCEQLEVKKTESEGEYGLVLVKDNDLATFVRNEIGPTRGGGTRKVNTNSESAIANGSETGKGMNLSKGLTGGTSNEGKLLGA